MQEIEERVLLKVEEVVVCLVEELDGGTVVGSLMGFLESSGKTSHTVSH